MRNSSLSSTWSAAAAALLFIGAGCGGQPAEPQISATGGAPEISYADYLAHHVAQEPGGSGYLVEGDIRLPDQDAVRAYWQETVRDTARGGALSIRRVNGADVTRPPPDRWNITYCVRPSDFGSDYSRLVLMLHKAASGWERAADVRFVHKVDLDNSGCDRSNTNVLYNVERNFSFGSGLAAGMGFPDYARSVRYLELGQTSAWTDMQLLAVLTHELGHSLGFVHEHDTAPGCGRVTNDVAGYRQLTCYDGRGAMHYPFKPGWLDQSRQLNFISQWDVEGAQAAYGAPTNVINLANGTVFARQRPSGNIYQRTAAGWVQIGGPGQAFVAVGNTLYGQTPGSGSPVKYTGAGWVYIGGPAGQIFGCLGTLCSTVPNTGDIAKYNPAAGSWTVIGGPGSRFASSATQLFGIGPWQDDYVARYTGAGSSWVVAGSGASELFGGGTGMYQLTNVKDAIQRYNFDGSWTTIGGAGRNFVATGSNVYGLTPDRSWVMKYNGTQWNSVYGHAAGIYGTAGSLFVTNDDDTIAQYNPATSTWTNLGKP